MSGINYDLTKIRGFAFDVDGVLSPSVIPMSENGEPLRMANIKDGYALQLAAKLGYKLAIITGGNTIAVKNRYEALGFKDIFLVHRAVRLSACISDPVYHRRNK